MFLSEKTCVRSCPRTTLILACSALALTAGIVVGSVDASDLPDDAVPDSSSRFGESIPEKSASCVPDGTYCYGNWAGVVNHLYTEPGGAVRIHVTAALQAEIQSRGFCSLEAGWFIVVREEGGDKTVLEQLYMSRAMDIPFGLRFQPGTQYCSIAYVRTLYPE